MSAPLLAVDGLTVSFRSRDRWLPAVRASTSVSRPVRRWRWSASRARARAPRCSRSWGCSARRRALRGVLLDGSDLLSASPRTLRGPRQPDRDGVPGPAVVAQPGDDGRDPADRDAAPIGASAAAARTRALELLRAADHRPGGPLAGLPARAVGRHAPAGDVGDRAACDPVLIADEPTTAPTSPSRRRSSTPRPPTPHSGWRCCSSPTTSASPTGCASASP